MDRNQVVKGLSSGVVMTLVSLAVALWVRGSYTVLGIPLPGWFAPAAGVVGVVFFGVCTIWYARLLVTQRSSGRVHRPSGVR